MTGRIGLILFSMLLNFSLKSQPLFQPLNVDLRALNQRVSDTLHFSEPSYSGSLLPSFTLSDSTGRPLAYNYYPVGSKSEFLVAGANHHRSWFIRKLVYEHFISIDTGKFYLTIDPLLNVAVGKDKSDFELLNGNQVNREKDIYTNSRGFRLRALLGKNVGVETYVLETQAFQPYYLDTFVVNHGVVPGQGRVKRFKRRGYDYSLSGGFVSWRPANIFNLQLGHHRLFLGEGYRSLVLSDNAFNYPFARFNFSFLNNRIRYSTIHMSLQNLNRVNTGTGSEFPFERKAAAYQVLEFNVTKSLKFSFYQGMVWQTMDSTGRAVQNLEQYNPVIFYNAVNYGLDGRNNALIGGSVRFTGINKLALYATAVTDDNQFRTYGVQGGFSYFLTNTLRLQYEWNKVSPSTYFTPELSGRQSFTHYNQPLAHPLGSGFTESVAMIHFRYRRLLVNVRMMFAEFDNKGQMIYKEKEIGLTREQGINQTIRVINSSAELAYLVNPASNLKAFVSYTLRKEEKSRSQTVGFSSALFYFGFRTDLFNNYYDF